MRTIARVILSAIFLGITALLVVVAKAVPDVFFGYYHQFSQGILTALSAITSIVPFALWEILLGLLILWAVYTLIMNLRKMQILRWLSGVLVIVSGGVLCFVAFWGLGHFGPSTTQQMGLSAEQYTVEQLQEAAIYYAQQANLAGANLPTNSDGTTAMTSFEAMSDVVLDGYVNLNLDYPDLGVPNATVKKLTAATLYSYTGTTGIFMALTGESSVNPQTYGVSLPFTMCHELAHRLGVTAEDEANFFGFLASVYNDDPYFQYSAYYSAFIYTFNALYAVDANAALQLWDIASPQLLADCQGANTHYEPYKGKVQEVTEQVNDTYLKVFDHADGVQSYGAVADQLIAWYELVEKS